LGGYIFTHRATTMANNYVGLSVIVMLQHPPNTLVYGLVADINPATATLTLHNGTFYLSIHIHTHTHTHMRDAHILLHPTLIIATS